MKILNRKTMKAVNFNLLQLNYKKINKHKPRAKDTWEIKFILLFHDRWIIEGIKKKTGKNLTLAAINTLLKMTQNTSNELVRSNVIFG